MSIQETIKKPISTPEPIIAYLYFGDVLLRTVKIPNLLPSYELVAQEYSPYKTMFNESKAYEKIKLFRLVFDYESMVQRSKFRAAIYRFAGIRT